MRLMSVHRETGPIPMCSDNENDCGIYEADECMSGDDGERKIKRTDVIGYGPIFFDNDEDDKKEAKNYETEASIPHICHFFHGQDFWLKFSPHNSP